MLGKPSKFPGGKRALSWMMSGMKTLINGTAIGNPLNLGGFLGTKWGVTSRNENVGRIMGGIEPYKLQKLSDDDSWSVFKSHAFRDGDCSAHPELEAIGMEIVKKLKGLPLASKKD